MARTQGNTLWYKISVEFFDHPKIFTVPINPRELFQRAICYSKKHLTDGYLTRDTLRHIAKHQAADVCECIRKGRQILEICDEWIDVLYRAKLLDAVDEHFFQIHDYLKWNPSKEHVAELQKKRRIAGSSGGKVKYLNKLSSSKLLANCQAKTYPETESESETETKEKSITSQVSKKPSKQLILDDEWIAGLKSDPVYAGIDIDLQYRKASAWYPAHGRKLSRKAFINWLIREMGNKPIMIQPTIPYTGPYHKKVQL